jgi:hypothetical protein
MPITRKQMAKSNMNVYEKADELPDERKKIYESILEDFDKQGFFLQNCTFFRLQTLLRCFLLFWLVISRIEQIYSSVNALQKQIRSQFKVALLQQPRSVRDIKVEEFYYTNDENEAYLAASSTSTNLTAELAKLAAISNSNVSKEVKTTVKGSGKKRVSGAAQKKKKSSILSGALSSRSAARRSTRNRFASSSLLSENPLASSTLTTAALGCTTAKSSRTKARMMTAQTPAGASGMSFLGGRGMITPKFNPNTPMNRSVMRTKREDEKWLVSMNGSPVYIGGRKGKGNDNNVIPLPLGNGNTLMVPADNPQVQNLIQSCMSLMNKQK